MVVGRIFYITDHITQCVKRLAVSVGEILFVYIISFELTDL